jgi:diguanylate cyclase (GGDEF)-like protein
MIATAQANVNQQASRDQGRVLLVSDEGAGAACGPALEAAGLVVIPADKGAAAIVALSRARPHAVVADVGHTRGITAEELARSLAEDRWNVPLVFVGAEEATRARRLDALTAGAFDYFRLPEETDLFVARARQLVEYRQTLDRLRAEADRDYLTGLANRRRFRSALGKEVERWRRYRVPCALLLADIDHLKRINDAFGHSAGDTVIRHVAGVLAEHSRDNDTAARLGGEEFALLLAGVDGARARTVAERLRLDICERALPGIGVASVSIGVASCPAHADSERALYSLCDDLMFRAKREGRNRVAFAGDVNAVTGEP